MVNINNIETDIILLKKQGEMLRSRTNWLLLGVNIININLLIITVKLIRYKL